MLFCTYLSAVRCHLMVELSQPFEIECWKDDSGFLFSCPQVNLTVIRKIGFELILQKGFKIESVF